jgi:hypothetical protein
MERMVTIANRNKSPAVEEIINNHRDAIRRLAAQSTPLFP